MTMGRSVGIGDVLKEKIGYLVMPITTSHIRNNDLTPHLIHTKPRV